MGEIEFVHRRVERRVGGLYWLEKETEDGEKHHGIVASGPSWHKLPGH